MICELAWPVATPQTQARSEEAAEHLARNASRLFSQNGSVDFWVTEVFATGIVPATSLLEPGYSWSELPITYKAALDPFSTFHILPEFSEYLSAFGRKSFPRDESFASFDCRETFDENGAMNAFESCYLLKYIGLREDASKGTNPWSIRHSLIYQKVDFKTCETNHILIRIPETMENRLGESVLKDTELASDFVKKWAQLHSMSFGSVGDNLRQFINYLDEEVTSIFERIALAGVEPDILNEFDTPHSSATDMKTIHYLEDQAQRILTLINLNIETMGCLMRQAKRLRARGRSSDRGMLTQFEDQMQKIKQDHRFSLLHVSAIIKRSRSVSEQLRDTIALRNSEINKKQTEMATGHTKAIFNLSKISSQEAQVVKTLTGLALIFVPASYVAMGYVSPAGGGKAGWSAEPGLKIYATLAIPLIAVTMLIYAAVEWRNRQQQNAEKRDGSMA
ncbi:hypothetical protein EDB81DRAFT_842978 [Dactylonectria macrodidyma]|uniref:CorA-like transporter domain-containing protein n=1 Tax=Dactylonectria macrodidyma TaxID=307937 RepID=A0A9P9ESD1_9HYPO|nr:hypothetical protein EDB81DRAFT_842978 [Dactylonectria macrodidyma]